MPFPSPITSMKLRVSSGVSPSVETFEQNITYAHTGLNTVPITSELVSTLNGLPAGTIFTPSIVTTYGSDSLTAVYTTSVSNFVTKKITPTISLANIPNKIISDAPFSLSSFIITDSTGALSYSSSLSSVATVSSAGLVTILGTGTTTITVNQAASTNGVYSAATPVSSSFQVQLPPKEWKQRGFDIDGEEVEDWSGYSVSLSSDGTTLAIGGPFNDATGSDAGHVRVYKYDATKLTAQMDQTLSNFGPIGWNRLGADIDGEAVDDWSGASVSLSSDGTTLAIGAPYNNSASGFYAGHVRVYKYDANKLTAQMDQTLSNFGPIGWNRLGADIDGESVYNLSGFSVSLSSDGTTLAVGGRYGHSASDSYAGHVRVYKYDATKLTAQMDQASSNFGPGGWNRLGADIDGEATNDRSGWSVSLSSDGTTIAIGAPYNTASGLDAGHVRVYKYDANKLTAQMDQTSSNFGPIGWNRLGEDIDAEAADDESGTSVSLSYDGTILAIGAQYNNDASGSYAGHVRVYKYDANKLTAQMDDETLSNFGPIGWNRLGEDIDAEAPDDSSGYSVSLSFDGTTLAIGAPFNSASVSDSGHVRVYKYDANKTDAVTDQTSLTFGPIGWNRLGADIYGEAADDCSGYSVSLSSDGTTLAIGAPFNSASGTDAGHVRVYKYDLYPTLGTFSLPSDILIYTNQTITRQLTPPTSNSNGLFVYTSSNTAVATITNNAGVYSINVIGGGSTTITATQTASGIYASTSVSYILVVSVVYSTLGIFSLPSDVSLYMNETITRQLTPPTSNISDAFTFTSSNTDVATITNNAGVYSINVIGGGSTTITATQAASGIYASTSVSYTLVVSVVYSTLGTFSLPTDIIYMNQMVTRQLTPPTSNRPGAFTFTSSNTAVATITNDAGVYSVNVIGAGTSIITATQAASGIYASTSVSSTLIPLYSTWRQRGADIDGEAIYDESGYSVCLSSDGTTLAIGAPYNNDANGSYAGHVRVYKYDATKLTAQMDDETSSNFGPIGWNRLGADIDAEAADDSSGYSVSLSSDGTTLAIGAPYNSASGSYAGHVRVYKYDANKLTAQMDETLSNFGPIGWNRLGADIDGEAADDSSGLSISLSSDGTTLAIGAPFNSASGTDAGHVRVYKYDANKLTAQMDDETSPNFGPIGWNRLGADIYGEAENDWSGSSVSLSSDGTTLAVGGILNDGNGEDAGHVRVYKYDATKLNAQMDQTLSNFGPIGWNRLGEDIDGEAAGDVSGVSVSLSSDGTTLAIGGPYNDASGSYAGHVRVYKYDANKLTAQMDDETLSNFGPVGWNRLGADIDAEAAHDESGTSVSLSYDGTILAIGGPYNSTNGSSAGHVRVYKYDANKLTAQMDETLSNFGPIGWNRLGADIYGEAEYENAGWCVSLSSDGTTLAIGAPFNNESYSSAGHVRVYKYDLYPT
jgi:hypothetical protein